MSESEKETVKVPVEFKEIVQSLEGLTLLQVSELVKVLEEKWGVSSAAPVMTVAAGPAAGAAEHAEEKTLFNVVLSSIGEQKIEVIKVVRDATGKGLKEAKDLVDAAIAAPQVVKEGAKKEEAEELKKKLETAGAKAELK
ncbi:MAG: 50S ribosomal protein L7/L12 [Candidatus Wildermuthbacteria bacterium]|nr:50S ribosomal protein L7/L12 [Candidatus Wildermuthbacteria bacterium]